MLWQVGCVVSGFGERLGLEVVQVGAHQVRGLGGALCRAVSECGGVWWGEVAQSLSEQVRLAASLFGQGAGVGVGLAVAGQVQVAGGGQVGVPWVVG